MESSVEALYGPPPPLPPSPRRVQTRAVGRRQLVYLELGRETTTKQQQRIHRHRNN